MCQRKVSVDIQIVVMKVSHIIVGKSDMDPTGNSNTVEVRELCGDDATNTQGMKMPPGSAGRMSRARSINAIAGPSHLDHQRRLPKRPDADVPTPSPKHHWK